MKETSFVIKKENYTSYPFLSRLLELHDIPKEIHILGELPEISFDIYGRATPRILTIVGSRKHTEYAKDVIEKLVESLKGYDVIIVSGLAFGIDSIAHKTALKHNIKTLSVPGSGLSEKVLYPKSHIHLAKEIIEKGGVLLSELEDQEQAAPWTFPARNRIMAALSDAVLIIEAEEKSGTLITAKQALELGRDIGAIPGNIFSPTSYGTNELLRNGAYCINTIESLFSLLHLSQKERERNDTEFTEDQKKILENLLEPTDKDILLFKTGMSPENFLTTLSSLEIEGVTEESFGEVRRLV